MKRIDPKTAAELTDAVRELEACSCAELVLEVRARSGSYAQADGRFAAIVAFLALVFLLFSPVPFAPLWVIADVAIAYAIGWAISRRSNAVRRLMTSEKERARQVRTVASSIFFERGVANTERESGLVIYLSMLERRIEIIADRGVLLAVPALEWNRVVGEARASRAADPRELLRVIRAVLPLLQQHLPVREGDRDELANALRFEEE